MASESPLEILMDWQLLIAMEITCSPSVHPAWLRICGQLYRIPPSCQAPGIVDQSGVTILQRLPFRVVLVHFIPSNQERKANELQWLVES